MKLRKATESPELAKARKRVAKLGNRELYEWLDSAISGIGKGFSDYRSQEQVESLLEIRDHAIPGLVAIVDEFILRWEAAESD